MFIDLRCCNLVLLSLKRVFKHAGERADSAPGILAGDAARAADDAIVCGGCEHPVTSRDLAVEIAGQHRHTRINPANVIYRVRCFSRAEGCLGHGEVTERFSWFAGYAWQIALCERCAMHLGWLFTSAEGPAFAGLIADRIIERASPEG